MTTSANITVDGDQVKVVLDFQVPSFIHALLMLDDFKNNYAWIYLSATNKKSYFQNVSFYIGNDANTATNNQLCQGSPFLDITDPDNYLDDPNTSNGSNLKPWKYGEEVFCNKEGRYLHVIANLQY